MTENNHYTQAIKIMGFILLPVFIISSVLNILFITNVVEENVMRIGITGVLFISLIMNLINCIKVFIHKELRQEIKNPKRFDKIFSYLTIIFMIVWVMSFMICILK